MGFPLPFVLSGPAHFGGPDVRLRRVPVLPSVPPCTQGFRPGPPDLKALHRVKAPTAKGAELAEVVTSDWDAARRKFEGPPAAPTPAAAPPRPTVPVPQGVALVLGGVLLGFLLGRR